VVLDGSHNPDAVAELAATLDEAFAWETLHVVLGMFEDKDVEGVLAALAPLAVSARVHVARPRGPRAADSTRVAAAARAAGFTVDGEYDSVPDAVTAAVAGAGEADLILVTGSFYTVADARPLFLDA
jgi:dihydrofolate synthase/folylpolyglutamate synthase